MRGVRVWRCCLLHCKEWSAALLCFAFALPCARRFLLRLASPRVASGRVAQQHSFASTQSLSLRTSPIRSDYRPRRCTDPTVRASAFPPPVFSSASAAAAAMLSPRGWEQPGPNKSMALMLFLLITGIYIWVSKEDAIAVTTRAPRSQLQAARSRSPACIRLVRLPAAHSLFRFRCQPACYRLVILRAIVSV